MSQSNNMTKQGSRTTRCSELSHFTIHVGIQLSNLASCNHTHACSFTKVVTLAFLIHITERVGIQYTPQCSSVIADVCEWTGSDESVTERKNNDPQSGYMDAKSSKSQNPTTDNHLLALPTKARGVPPQVLAVERHTWNWNTLHCRF